MANTVLEVKNIEKSYAGVRALRRANFSVIAGEVHALMGENGAGKSTLAKIIAGTTRADSGQLLVDGKAATVIGPADAQKLGISIIYQELDLFPNLSVAENIVIRNQEFGEHGLVRSRDMHAFAGKFLRQVGLAVAPGRRVSSLGIGEMQLVMIARALSMRTRILVMDEPTSSLFHDSVERLFSLIARLKAQQVAIVYVSHKMDEIFRICDRMTVMRDGETIGTRQKREAAPGELISMMVGRPWRVGERSGKREPGAMLLSVAGLTTRKLKGVDFGLRTGEVLGIAGLVGAGRSELGAALVGLDHWKEGTMALRGRPVSVTSTEEAQRIGIRLLPEDRKLDGLMMQMSVLENGTLADLPKLAAHGITHRRKEVSAVAPLLQRLAFKSSSLNSPVNTLSGGGQQKVLFARCLLGNPDVLFLDEPTRGIDVGAKEDVYQVVEQLARQGKGILFVSSELPELLRCCHRILVMREGQITADLSAQAATQEEIMSYATTAITPAKGTF